MGQILIPPDDVRVGANPVRTVITPSGLYVPAADAGAEQQVITQAGPDGTLATVSPYGYARVATEPQSTFTEAFDGAIDTLDRWTTGGTVPPSVSGGYATVAPGAVTASASSSLVTKMTTGPQGLTFRTLGWVSRFENAGAGAGQLFYTNTHRFVGLGTVPATWTAANTSPGTVGPLLDAIGFEIGTDGAMYPVVYAGGVRLAATITGGGANLNVGRTLPNGAHHQMAVTFRSDALFWYIDGLTQPVASLSFATTGFQVPNSQTLPLRVHTINFTSPASGIPVVQVASIALADTGNNTATITDGVLPYRKARVTDPAIIGNALLYGAGAQTAGAALNVNTNAVQLAAYKAVAKPSAAALVANTPSARVSLHHTAGATKTVKIRKIAVSALMSGVIEAAIIEIYRVTSAPAGTGIAAGIGAAGTGSLVPMHPADPACEAVLTNSITSAGTYAGYVATGFLCYGSAAAIHGGGALIYDWSESGEVKPIVLRPAVLEGIQVMITSNGAVTPTLTVEIEFTEE